jgi:hypothetical protein
MAVFDFRCKKIPEAIYAKAGIINYVIDVTKGAKVHRDQPEVTSSNVGEVVDKRTN